MTESETIVKMIENVHPADTAKLDEIDKRVFSYWKRIPFESDRFCWSGREENRQWEWEVNPHEPRSPTERVYRYTHSRDALKAIRPEGWYITLLSATDGYKVILNHWGDGVLVAQVKSLTLPTEELAELHAIIQAIEYERRSVATSP